MLRLSIAGWFVAAVTFAQSAGPDAQKFEVATIRPCASPEAKRGGLSTTPGMLRATCTPVKFLIQAAYAPSADASVAVSGGPGWLDSDLYDIEAKAGGDVGLDVMRGPMLQALLEDRFTLKIHRETREVPVYELTVAKGGPRVQAFQEGSCVAADSQKAPASAPGQKRPVICGSFNIGLKDGKMTLEVHRRSVAEFSGQLRLDRPVIDKTGITGWFDFHLECTPDGTTAEFFPPGFPINAPADSPGGVSIFTAIQEQLGLRLEPARGPGEFWVIDSVERPTGN